MLTLNAATPMDYRGLQWIMYGIVSQSDPQASRTGKSPKRPYDGLTTLQLAYYLLDSEPDSKPALRPPGQRIGPGDLTETSRLPWFNMLQNLTNPEGPINSVAEWPWGRATVSQTVHIDFAPLRHYRGICISILSLCGGLLLPAGLRIGSQNGPEASRAQNWARRPDAGLTRCGWASSEILRIRKALNLYWPNLILGSITFQHRWPDLIVGSMTFRHRWPELILGSMTFRHCRPDLILGSMTFRHRETDPILGSMTFRHRREDLVLGSPSLMAPPAKNDPQQDS